MLLFIYIYIYILYCVSHVNVTFNSTLNTKRILIYICLVQYFKIIWVLVATLSRNVSIAHPRILIELKKATSFPQRPIDLTCGRHVHLELLYKKVTNGHKLRLLRFYAILNLVKTQLFHLCLNAVSDSYKKCCGSSFIQYHQISLKECWYLISFRRYGPMNY